MPSFWLVVASVTLVSTLLWLGWFGDLHMKRYKLNKLDKRAYLPSAVEPLRNPQRYMQIVVSLILLGVALYVILSKQYAAADTNWAYGIVGTIIGYWLKGK